MIRHRQWADLAITLCGAGLALVVGQAGCASVPLTPEAGLARQEAVIVGRIVTLLTAPSTRPYAPAMVFVELVNMDTRQRVRVDLDSDDRTLIVPIPPGRYEVSRMGISEGPFRSMSDLALAFRVEPATITYVGTWRVLVDAPRYGRMVVVSVSGLEKDRERAQGDLRAQHPTMAEHDVTVSLPQPAVVETRLYEVASYPRVPRYFRRHPW